MEIAYSTHVATLDEPPVNSWEAIYASRFLNNVRELAASVADQLTRGESVGPRRVDTPTGAAIQRIARDRLTPKQLKVINDLLDSAGSICEAPKVYSDDEAIVILFWKNAGKSVTLSYFIEQNTMTSILAWLDNTNGWTKKDPTEINIAERLVWLIQM